MGLQLRNIIIHPSGAVIILYAASNSINCLFPTPAASGSHEQSAVRIIENRQS